MSRNDMTLKLTSVNNIPFLVKLKLIHYQGPCPLSVSSYACKGRFSYNAVSNPWSIQSALHFIPGKRVELKIVFSSLGNIRNHLNFAIITVFANIW